MPDHDHEIVVKITESAPTEELIAIYKSAGWWESCFEQDTGFLNSIVKDSALFAGAFCNGRLIGMGRALSDSASDAYIQDVAILTEFRGRGIGERIVKTVVQKLREKGVDWIGVVAEPGTDGFYEKIGFSKLENHVPMKYDGK